MCREHRGEFFDPYTDMFNPRKNVNYKDWAFFVAMDRGEKIGLLSLTIPLERPTVQFKSKPFWLYHMLLPKHYLEQLKDLLLPYISHIRYVLNSREEEKQILLNAGFQVVKFTDSAYGKMWVMCK